MIRTAAIFQSFPALTAGSFGLGFMLAVAG